MFAKFWGWAVVLTFVLSAHGRHIPRHENHPYVVANQSSASRLHVKRAVNPACMKSAETTCRHLADSCVLSISSGNRNNMWSLKPCVTAATCYGVGSLISSVNCQYNFNVKNQDQASLDYNLYAAVVGDCAWAPGGCPITQQNYVDLYYHSLEITNTPSWPSSSVVIGYWSSVTSWTATGSNVPYTNFNDYLHYSSYPTDPNPSSPSNPSPSAPPPSSPSSPGNPGNPTTNPPNPNPSQTSIPWNPNPTPPPGAVSQTIVRSSTTTVIAIPTQTTTVIVGGATITIAPGGTPVGSVPPDVRFPNAITPTWNPNPIIPTSLSSATFTSGTWTTVVPLPTSTDSPVVVHGPPDDDDDDDDDWLLILGLAGVIIIGVLPPGVGVVGGFIPVPVPPPTWPPNNPWVPPPVAGSDPDDPDDDDDDDDEFCDLTFPDIPSEPDDEEEFVARSKLFARAGSDREFRVPRCPTLPKYTRNGFTLTGAPWYTVNLSPGTISDSRTLQSRGTTTSKPTQAATPNTIEYTIHEHLFEFRYLSDFFNDQFTVNDCAWLGEFWEAEDDRGVEFKEHLFRAIDQAANSVWADDVINKVKSSVSNDASNTPQNPPLAAKMDSTTDWTTATQKQEWYKVEMYLRAFAMLGQYFDENKVQFAATAARVQTILAQYTPTTPLNPPLDTRFQTYMHNTFLQYENRVQLRGVNMLAKYKSRMEAIRDAKRIITQNPNLDVPTCFPVYHSPVIGFIFNSIGINPNPVPTAQLIPAAIQHPICNVAGTEGDVIWRFTSAGQAVYTAGTPRPRYKIMGIGSSYYGLSRITPGANGAPATYSWMYDISPTSDASCAGVRALEIFPTTAVTVNFPKAQFELDCQGATTPTAPSRLTSRDLSGGNTQTCFSYDYNDGTDGYNVLCGNQANVDSCIGHLNTRFNRPNGGRTALDFRFIP